MKTTLKKTKYGFYQYFPLPNQEILTAYYTNKYYQNGLGSYETTYDDAELKWRQRRAILTILPMLAFERERERERISNISGNSWTLAVVKVG